MESLLTLCVVVVFMFFILYTLHLLIWIGKLVKAHYTVFENLLFLFLERLSPQKKDTGRGYNPDFQPLTKHLKNTKKNCKFYTNIW